MPNKLPGVQVFVTIDSTTITSVDSNIIEVSVEDSDEGDNEISVSFEDNDFAVADSPLFVVGKKMSVKWGYIGGEMSQLRSGILMKPSVAYTSEGVTTKVCAKTKSATLAARRPQKTYGKTTVKDIVSEIANRSGLTLDIKGGSESVEAFAHSNWSDRQVLRVLADRYGYQVSYNSDTIIFAPRDYGAVPSINLVYGQGEGSNVHEAHLNVDASKQLGDSLTQAISVDPNSKKVVKQKSDKDTQTLAISAEDGHSWLQGNPALAPASNMLQGLQSKVTSVMDSAANQAEDILSHVSTPESDPTTAKLLATAEKLKKQKKKGELSVNSLGLPSATSRKVVTVSGLAKRDSGNWYVISVTHKITQDGYECDWELGRHGNNTRKPPVKNKEPVNKKSASKSEPTKKVIAVNATTGKVTE